MKKKLLAAIIFFGFAAVSHAAIGVTVKINGGTLQPGTTEGINLSSGTIVNGNITNAKIQNISGITTDTSTTTYSGAHTFSSATITNANIGSLLNNMNANSKLINNVSTPTAAGDAPRMHNVGIVQMAFGGVTAASNTTSGSYVNTLLTATITPQFSDSKIGIIVFAPGWFAGGATGSKMRIVRGASTDISGDCQWTYNNPTTYGFGSQCFGIEVSPGTSAVTYTMQMKSSTAGQNIGTCDGTNACAQSMIIFEVNQK